MLINPPTYYMMLMSNTLSPIIHQYNRDLYRVPLRKVENDYTMYVGHDYTRKFDENTLPDDVKTKMAMILAVEQQILRDHEVSPLYLMETRHGDLIDIGWRVSDTWFIVMLHTLLLKELRGEI